MDLGIKDKVMIVTGGARGIGEGIARCIAREGAIPIIADRSADAGIPLEEEERLSHHFPCVPQATCALPNLFRTVIGNERMVQDSII